MRLILLILLLCSFGADAQMIIKAHANYRPYAQPAANLLLDDYPNAAAAYSLRKLRTAYSGSAIRVRRSNDNAESDIGFTSSGDLDTASLKTFVGANSGYVTTWHDQSGNGRNTTQGTAANQPRIVNSGVIDRENGKPALIYDGSNDFLGAATASHWEFLHFGNHYTAFTIARAGNVTDPENIYFLWGTTATVLANGAYLAHDTRSSVPRDRAQFHVIGSGANGIVALNAQTAGTTPANTQFLSYLIGNPNEVDVASRSFLATNNGATQYNNTDNAQSSAGNPNHALRIGTAANASGVNQIFLLGSTQEIIFYNSNQATNRTGIQNNINDYYNIYWNGDFTGILDTYGSSAAAYSLRNLSSTYKGPLIRVRRSNDNAEQDIFGDYYGNLDTVGLKNFVGANNGFVTTWYDQSGNSRNATQSTAASQPRIVNAGVVDRNDNKVTVFFDGSSDFIPTTNSASLYQNISSASIFTVARSRNTSLAFTYYALAGTTGNSRLAIVSSLTSNRYSIFGRRNDADAAAIINNSNPISITQNRLQTGIFLWSSSDAYQYINGSLDGSSTSWLTDGNTANTTSPTVSIGETFSSVNISEIIVYISNQSSNRTGIESNINTYYSIY